MNTPLSRLEIDEIAKLLDAVEDGETCNNVPERNIIIKQKYGDLAIPHLLLLGTGIRVSECVGLDISDLKTLKQTECDRIHRKGGADVILNTSE